MASMQGQKFGCCESRLGVRVGLLASVWCPVRRTYIVFDERCLSAQLLDRTQDNGMQENYSNSAKRCGEYAREKGDFEADSWLGREELYLQVFRCIYVFQFALDNTTACQKAVRGWNASINRKHEPGPPSEICRLVYRSCQSRT